MEFYLRTAVLTVGSLIFEGRVSFSIEKEANGAAPCEIKAYNLSRVHRAELEAKGSNQLTIYLSAGYGGVNKLLYAGKVLYTESAREGADIVTTFHSSSTVDVLHRAVLSLSGQLDDMGIYERCLTALAPFGVVRGYLSPAVEQSFRGGGRSRGYSGLGYTSTFLDEITRRHGLTWGIDGNNSLNIHSKDEFEDNDEIEVSSSSGMIGFPTKIQTSGCYKVRSLLNAELSPGKRIRIKSIDLVINGSVKIIKATHVGDTLTGDWYTEVDAMGLHVAPNLSGVTD